MVVPERIAGMFHTTSSSLWTGGAGGAAPPCPSLRAPLSASASGGPLFDRPSSAASPSSGGSAALRQTRDILVVEDDPALRETVRLALQDVGHQVAVAAEGAEALDSLQRGHYCTLLLDLLLPGLD